MKFLTKTKWIKYDQLVIPSWALKDDFYDDDERERFTASLEDGTTALHAAQLKEKPKSSIYEVCDGVHRAKLIIEQKIERVPIYDHGRISKAERQKIALRYAWQFQTDTQSVAAVLRELAGGKDGDVDEMLLTELKTSLQFDDSEINRMLASLEIDAHNDDDEIDDATDDEIDEEPKRRTQRKNKARRVKCPHCEKHFNLPD